MLIRQVWTSHNGRDEGGRATHSLPLEFEEITDEARVTCGTDLSHLIATAGKAREVPADKLELYIDCRRCLRILRTKKNSTGQPAPAAADTASLSSPA